MFPVKSMQSCFSEAKGIKQKTKSKISTPDTYFTENYLQKQIKGFNFTENILAIFASSQYESSDIWLTLTVASIYVSGATAYITHF